MKGKAAAVFKDRKLVMHIGLLVLIALTLSLTGVLYPSTEMAVLLIIILAILNPKVRVFAVDFAPFIILLFTYDTLRNFADDFGSATIHVSDLIRWERSVGGGTLPPYWLQQNLWGHFYTPVLDVLANFFYMSHFMTPLLASIAMWRHRRTDYWAFAFGLVAMSFAAFATYIFFPAAPPWWATQNGYLPDMPIVLDHFIVSAEVVAKGPNPVAAMPSLHTAYPTFIALTSLAVFGRKAIPVILLPLCVASSTFYLGHHWVIDALGGA
ncbi:MAG: inositol phosphorylceramide synthase, partial [Chloroflexi bacterium]|nr:inositol phosphorylceramide synthase [Chloroflexota bacterium]